MVWNIIYPSIFYVWCNSDILKVIVCLKYFFTFCLINYTLIVLVDCEEEVEGHSVDQSALIKMYFKF